MKRTSFVMGAVVAISAVASVPAFASEAAPSCTTAYAAAMESDALVNGPVHFGGPGGFVSVGPFTPSVFVSGAEAPTAAYVACL